jgi:hypothetical protein
MLGVIRSDGERAAVEEREKVLLSRLGSDRPATAAEAQQLEKESVQRLERDVAQRVAVAGAAQDKVLSRMTMTAPAPPADKGYLSDESSIDNILGPLGDSVKREILRGDAPLAGGSGEGLDDSALWAFDDANTSR